MARGKQLWIALLSSALLAGCNASPELETTKQDNEKPVVLTTFTVLADMARQVAGDRLQVRSIVKPGAEIHGYEPTPSDLEQAADADLVVENGLGLELWADRFLRAAGDVPRLTLSQGMTPLLIEGDAYAGKPNPMPGCRPNGRWAMSMAWWRVLASWILRALLSSAAMARTTNNSCSNWIKTAQRTGELPPQQRLLVSCEGVLLFGP